MHSVVKNEFMLQQSNCSGTMLFLKCNVSLIIFRFIKSLPKVISRWHLEGENQHELSCKAEHFAVWYLANVNKLFLAKWCSWNQDWVRNWNCNTRWCLWYFTWARRHFEQCEITWFKLTCYISFAIRVLSNVTAKKIELLSSLTNGSCVLSWR